MPNLLLELGTEELPVNILDVVYTDLKPKAEEAFKKARLSFESVTVQATPRRIALFVSGLALRQADEVLELSGPSLEKAYTPEGNPTPALEGFLKSKEASVKDVTVKETPRGKFIVIQKKSTGKPVFSVMPALLQELLSTLTFPKNMRWESTGFRFPRPLRWVVALLDKKILPFQFAGLKASNKSFGHRFLAPKPLTIPSADWLIYKKLLKKGHVVLDLEERKNLIVKGLESKFKQNSFDEELLHTTSQLVEEPYLLAGTFSKTYLELPKEVLASCMKKNQKIFACYDAKGYLTGQFVAVLNGGKGKSLAGIRAGYENVLESRLKDAKYFYTADTQEPLEKKLHLLAQVTYLGKLGNMLQKTERMEKLAESFSELSGQPLIKEDLKRAAHLSKIDLMTKLVYEFPDLQGIVGREYALAGGEKEAVALSIGAQYFPKSLTEDHKELKKEMNLLGAMLGILDRIDLLAGAFGSGIQPTGSQDPYALRRAGGSVVKMIRAFSPRFSMSSLIQNSAGFYGNVLLLSVRELTDKLMKFFEERIVFELQAKAGTREYEILQAIMRSGVDDFAGIFNRYEKLIRSYQDTPENFIRAAKVVERTGNIIKGSKSIEDVNPSALQDAVEKRLFDLFSQKAQEIRDCVARQEYGKATARYGEIFYAPVNDFFEKVMVNVEDAAVKTNRQALMREINRLYTGQVADLSVLSRLDQA